MKVCVLGGTGFLGRRIANRFAQEGNEVFCLDVFPFPPQFDLGPHVHYKRLDATDFEQVVGAFATLQPDIAINLGFMRENFPRPAMKLNVLGMDNCLEAARLCNVKRVLYCSSIAVYGKQSSYGDRDILDDDPHTPIKQYDVHKVFNEWQAKEYREKHGMSVIGIRPANVSGIDKAIGSVDHVDIIVKPAMGQKITFDHRDRMRCVVHGNDVAELFFRVGVKPDPMHASYNSGGESLSLGDIAEMVKKVIPDAPIAFNHETGAKAQNTAYRFNNERMVAEFGIRYIPYETRVRRMIESIRSGAAMD